jgi:methyl-accepting chemotaxis protein
MSEAIDGVISCTAKIAQDTQDSFSAATEGKNLVHNTVEDMSTIQTVVDNLAKKVESLGERSHQIGEIIQVIDDIAEQTNLLSLNAAIEAARAGEHGKGFAVVANEVRKLAENSRKSTEEIRKLVIGIQDETEMVMKDMKKAITDVGKGTQAADKAGNALEDIIEAVNKAVTRVEEINAAMDDMKAHSREVVEAVETIAGITGENSRIVDELSTESATATESIMNVSAISEENAASTQEVTASAQEVTSNTNQMLQKIQSLDELLKTLQKDSRSYKLK